MRLLIFSVNLFASNTQKLTLSKEKEKSLQICVLFSFSDVDAVCPMELYSRVKCEGLQGAWSHKLLLLAFIFKHEKALCCDAHFKPYESQTTKLQSLFSWALGIHVFIGQVMKRECLLARTGKVSLMWLLEFEQCCLDECQGLLLSDAGEVSVIGEKVLCQLVLSPAHLTSYSPCPDPLSVRALWRS